MFFVAVTPVSHCQGLNMPKSLRFLASCACEPDFGSTEDGMWRLSQLACMIPPDFNSLEFWLCGHSKTSVYSNMINDTEVLEP